MIQFTEQEIEALCQKALWGSNWLRDSGYSGEDGGTIDILSIGTNVGRAIAAFESIQELLQQKVEQNKPEQGNEAECSGST